MKTTHWGWALALAVGLASVGCGGGGATGAPDAGAGSGASGSSSTSSSSAGSTSSTSTSSSASSTSSSSTSSSAGSTSSTSTSTSSSAGSTSSTSTSSSASSTSSASTSSASAASSMSSSASSASQLLIFTPSVLSIKGDPGFTATGQVNVKPNFAPLSAPSYLSVVDTDGMFTNIARSQPQNDGSINLTLTRTTRLPIGRYTGRLQMWVCADSACNDPLPGSPVSLPYDLAVGVIPNLTPLTRVVGAEDWTGAAGNLARTSYVPVAVDVARLSQRWRVNLFGPNVKSAISRLIVANGVVYAHVAGDQPMRALNEFDASLRWTSAPIAEDRPSWGMQPALLLDRLFIAAPSYPKSYIYGFSTSDGSLSSTTEIGDSTLNESMVAANAVLSAYLFSGSHLALDRLGRLLTPWIPASYGGGELLFDAQLGYLVGCGVATWGPAGRGWSPPISSKSLGYTCLNSPVAVGDGTLIAYASSGNANVTDQLVRIDAVNGKVLWMHAGAFNGEMALTPDTLYMYNRALGQIEARGLADGRLRWSVPNAVALRGVMNMVVTATHLFVETPQGIQALDLQTHQFTWTSPDRGLSMAISANGILYLTTSDGAIDAFNLR